MADSEERSAEVRPASATVRVSARPPAKFSSTSDFTLWIQRFELYLSEANVPAGKRARELVSLLDDEPFRVVSQLGLVTTDDYEATKEELRRQFAPAGNEVEWQYQLQTRRQRAGESLAGFAGELRMLTDRAYPGWEPKQRLEMARNHFVQGVRSPTIQLALMKEKPVSFEKALELAQAQEAVEAAQRRLQGRQAAVLSSSFGAEPVEEAAETNALHGQTTRQPSDQLQDLARQVRQLTDTVARLSARSGGDHDGGRAQRPWQQRGRGPPVCWGCRERGHLRRNCPHRGTGQEQSRVSDGRRAKGTLSLATDAALSVSGRIEQRETKMLVDTGSAVTIVREDAWREAVGGALQRPLGPATYPVVAANGEQLDLCGESEVTLRVGGIQANYSVLVARNITQECLLGSDFLQKFGCIIDLQSHSLSAGGKEIPLLLNGSPQAISCHVSCLATTVVPGGHRLLLPVQLPRSHDPGPAYSTGLLEPRLEFMERHGVLVAHSLSRVENGQAVADILNLSPAPVTIHQHERVATFQPMEEVCAAAITPSQHSSSVSSFEARAKAVEDLAAQAEGISQSEKEALVTLLQQFNGVLSLGDNDLGRTSLVRHKIDTGDAPPVKQAARRLPFHLRGEVKGMLERMENQGIIEPGNGPWAAPIVLAKKKDGSWRLCVDYRKMNSLTKKDAYPIPRIDDTLDALSGARWFSTIDLAIGYWQVEVEQTDREKTAFSTPFGLYQFKVMPFGLSNAPSTFQRLMEMVLAGLHWSTCLVYIDDIIVYSGSFEQHLERLEEVLRRLQRAGLKVKQSKCHLLQKRVCYLGHVLSEDGVETDPDKISCVLTWPVPVNIAQLRQFLGLASYYRRFVPKFAHIAAPLHRLTTKGNAWTWTPECDIAFQTLKQNLTHAPVLPFPQFDQPFIVDADASGEGLGAVLSQVIDDEEKVVAYASRALTKAERQYAATRREMLALVWSLKHFRPYLYGKPFRARTDHKSLQWLQSFRHPEGQVARWLQTLAEYQFTVEHRQGAEHSNADALSRRPNSHSHERVLAAASFTVNPSSSWVPHWTLDEVRQAQECDPNLGTLCQWMKSGTIPTTFPRHVSRTLQTLWTQRQDIMLEDGVLHRQWKDVPGKGSHRHLQLLLPNQWIPEVLTALHDSPGAGHLGVAKTLARAQSRFYWPGQRRDVEDWCRSCTKCASRKSPTHPNHALLQTELTGTPLQRVAMDILGPLPETERHNKYILVISDYFTKWAEALPIPNMYAETVAREFVHHFVCQFGVPEHLHTDQGKNFDSTLVKEVCRLLGIDKTRTTAYHPQSDGLVERLNRTILNMLSTVLEEDIWDWDLKLPLIMLAYRTSVQETTGASPFSLLFGREARLPVDVMFGLPPGETSTSPSQYALTLRHNLESIYHEVRTKTGLQQNRQKELYDQKSRGSPFKVGDLVWLHCPAVPRNSHKKFHCPWQGPSTVTKTINDVLYQISPQGSPRKKLIVHFDRLKPYHARQVPGGTQNQPESSDSESDKTGHEADPEDTEEDYFYFQEDRELPPHLPDQSDPQETESSEEELSTERTLRRSTRTRRPPDRYGVYIQH